VRSSLAVVNTCCGSSKRRSAFNPSKCPRFFGVRYAVVAGISGPRGAWKRISFRPGGILARHRTRCRLALPSGWTHDTMEILLTLETGKPASMLSVRTAMRSRITKLMRLLLAALPLLLATSYDDGVLN
jgi:hypothetical protein